VIRVGLFSLERTEIFLLRTYVRDMTALDRLLAGEWTDTTLPPPARRALAVRLRSHPGSGIVATDTFRLNVLRKSAG
jgi:hypothetical protein